MIVQSNGVRLDGLAHLKRLGALATTVQVDGRTYRLAARVKRASEALTTLRFTARDCPLALEQDWTAMEGGWHVATRASVRGDEPVSLGQVELLTLPSGRAIVWPAGAAEMVVMEQAAYGGQVVPFFDGSAREGHSEYVWVLADRRSGSSALVGFETADRWRGMVRTRCVGQDVLGEWAVGLDGGETLLEPGEPIALEQFVLWSGTDPLALLNRYGELVQAHAQPQILPQSPVTWCSWYPHRLGVSAERVLENGRVAAQRLKALGLQTMVVDLGWEQDYLPSLFVENDQFPDGLKGLANELEALGLELGTWTAPTSISEHDPLASEHPEWLIAGEDGTPYVHSTWYWHPRGAIHILDLTHPGARGWLADRVRSLAERGSRYIKADFIGNLTSPAATRRHDRHIVGGGGSETGHLAVRIMREAMRSVYPEARYLNCGGPELPGGSYADLLYVCNDTGNTGYVGWQHLQNVFIATATHLFKQRRWGIIQPSCLCVGLPGTLAEARLRATMAFMAGGQVDISDDLTTLPADRWQVLTATLPPQGSAATPVDLFQPIERQSGAYSTQATSIDTDEAEWAPPASLWALPAQASWDDWKLVAVFNYQGPEQRGERHESQLPTYRIPLDRVGVDAAADLWAFEFWSGQFSGDLPADPPAPPSYAHPGDMQMPLARPEPGILAVSFFGPGAMLLALREKRSHPWIVGTSFYQGCGLELSDVRWDEASRILSGTLNRPAGETGQLYVSARPSGATMGGTPAPCQVASSGAWAVTLTAGEGGNRWEIQF